MRSIEPNTSGNLDRFGECGGIRVLVVSQRQFQTLLIQRAAAEAALNSLITSAWPY